MNTPLIDPARTVIQHPADDLVRGAFGNGVIHIGGDVLMLVTATHIDRGQLAIGPRPGKRHMRLQPRQRAARAKAETGNRRPFAKRDTGCREMRCRRALGLYLDLLKPRPGADIDTDQRRCQPDIGLVPFGKLKMRARGKPDQNGGMR